MSYPGSLTRNEFATGLLVRSVKINGNYLLVDNCSINQTQEINSKLYLQGGPGLSVADIGAKKYQGELSFPIRVNKDNVIDPAAKAILQHAECPTYTITLDTNHLLSHFGITSEDGGTDNNELLSVDQLVVKTLTINCDDVGNYLKINVSFEGMIDTRANSDYAVPNENAVMGRALTWGDCDASRFESNMRSVSGFNLTITNELETPSFLMPGDLDVSLRSDQITLIGVKSVKWSGEFSEVLRKGSELHTHIHGGWMVDEYLKFIMGPITANFRNPLFQISELPLTAKILKRKTKWDALVNPASPLSQGGLFTFSE